MKKKNQSEILSEWVDQLAMATFSMGIDFPADAFDPLLAEKVQSKLLELYLVPDTWNKKSFFTLGNSHS